jgi:mannan endo-1,4-beta-mannosidase
MISDQNFNYNYGDMKLLGPGECTPADSCKFSDEEVSWKGQTDIAEFYKRSGHYPAIGGFDMLFAAGGHHEEGWFKGYTENNLLMTEDLWKMGGIPTYTWHWKVGEDTVFYTQGTPAGFNNPGCTEGVMGTSNTNTCFNYTKAFKGEQCQELDETSQEYKDIVADVDIVSGYFKQLQDKGIAVVWRPLHEASGGWFWWGVASAECYVQLYRLVFDRMVKTNKLTNLIWVWNINTDPKFGYDYSALNAAWYPGDAYVDIVAVDIYDPLNDHNSAANYYNKIVSDVGTSKMIALSENGAIPDIDSIAEDKAYWSYWMTWSQTWSGNFLEKTPADMWKRNLDDERIIALDDMPGWDNVNAGTTPIRSVITNKLNIALQGNNLSITVPQAGHTSIALFDMLGHKVVSLAKGNLPAGSLQFSLDGIARGNYIVRAKNGTMNYAQRIQVK